MEIMPAPCAKKKAYVDLLTVGDLATRWGPDQSKFPQLIAYSDYGVQLLRPISFMVAVLARLCSRFCQGAKNTTGPSPMEILGEM